MADFRVKAEPEVLRTTASEVTGLIRALQSDFDELQNCVKQTSRYWAGAAGDQYRGEFDAEKKVTSDLLSMAGIYTEAEHTVTQNNSALPSDIL